MDKAPHINWNIDLSWSGFRVPHLLHANKLSYFVNSPFEVI